MVYLMTSDRFIQHQKIDFSKFEKEIEALNASAEIKNEDTPSEKISKVAIATSPAVAAPERFMFNPNHLSESKWRKLGLTDKQIHSIKNYEAKGGSFRKKEDVKKMYTISLELYTSLEQYIEIPSTETSQVLPLTSPKIEKSISKIMDLNSADSAQLTTIKGIGPFYAKAIIRYRELLGGYNSKEQLMEVWKFDQEKYKAIEKFITVDVSKAKKININTCTAKELKHPYISWKIANGIINYREKHGIFNTVEELKKTDLLDEVTLLKIAPYLSTQN